MDNEAPEATRINVGCNFITHDIFMNIYSGISIFVDSKHV